MLAHLRCLRHTRSLRDKTDQNLGAQESQGGSAPSALGQGITLGLSSQEGSRFPSSAQWASHGLVPPRARFQNPWELGGDPSVTTATELCERLSAALLSHAVTARGRQPSSGSHSCLPLQHLLPTPLLLGLAADMRCKSGYQGKNLHTHAGSGW